MAYHHFDDVQEAARFIADIGFSIAGTSQGDFTSDHVKYHCNLSMGDSAFGTSFQSNPQYHDEPTVVDVLSSLCLDASSVDGVHIDDFADEMDFKKPSEAIRAYEGCKKALDWLKDGLGLDGEDIAQLGQTLDENEEEVKEAVTAIRDERAAEQERTHPEVPEGFVSIESLQASLDLGDYGDQLTEYEGYITDAIQECADSNIDIYYHDLLKWLPDNYEWIEEAEAQGLLEGAKGDIFKMTQMAQYECFSQDMYDHQEDICKNYVLESLNSNSSPTYKEVYVETENPLSSGGIAPRRVTIKAAVSAAGININKQASNTTSVYATDYRTGSNLGTSWTMFLTSETLYTTSTVEYYRVNNF